MTQTMQPDDPGSETTTEASAEQEMTYRDLVDRLFDRRTPGLSPETLRQLAAGQVATQTKPPVIFTCSCGWKSREYNDGTNGAELEWIEHNRQVRQHHDRQQAKEPSAVPCTPSTSSWGQLDQYKISDVSDWNPFDWIEDAGRKQAAQDPSVWDLPDSATRGAAKMKEAVLDLLWDMNGTGCRIPDAINSVRRLDPFKVVE